MEIAKIYAYALQREREGKKFFEENAARLSHASVVGIFERLAQEEQAHIEFIQRLLGHVDSVETTPAETLAIGVEPESQGFFGRRAESELLDQTVIESMTPDLPVLRMAYLIERDFAEFYEMAASRATGQAKEALALLARWERGHETLFKALHDRIFEEYINMPWGG